MQLSDDSLTKQLDHLIPCEIRLMETTYGMSNDGISMFRSVDLTLSQQDEIDMLLALANEGERCRYCNEPATHIHERIPLCTPKIANATITCRVQHHFETIPLATRRNAIAI